MMRRGVPGGERGAVARLLRRAMLTKTLLLMGLLAQRAGVISCAVPAGVVGALRVRGGADGGFARTDAPPHLSGASISHGPSSPAASLTLPADEAAAPTVRVRVADTQTLALAGLVGLYQQAAFADALVQAGAEEGGCRALKKEHKGGGDHEKVDGEAVTREPEQVVDYMALAHKYVLGLHGVGAEDSREEKAGGDLRVSGASEARGMPDFELAAEAYRKAAVQGNALALYNLGVLYLEGSGVTRDVVQSASLLSAAAARNVSAAQYLLGTLHVKGEGVQRDPQKAFVLFSEAAAAGHIDATEAVAECYFRGLGIPRHMRMAAHFFAEFDRLTEAQQDASGQGAVSEAAAIEHAVFDSRPRGGRARRPGRALSGFGGGAGAARRSVPENASGHSPSGQGKGVGGADDEFNFDFSTE